jgi:hypothetical protein
VVERALAKTDAGEPLTQKERAAVRVWEAEQLEQWGMLLLAAFPKKLLCDLLGTSQKVMLEKSRAFDLGYHTSGKTCQPIDVLRRLLQWTTDKSKAIQRLTNAAPGEGEPVAKDLNYWQREQAKQRALDILEQREERQRRVVDREVLVDLLRETFVEPLSLKQEQLDRRSGEIPVEEARGWFDEILENIERRIDTLIDTEAADEDSNG